MKKFIISILFIFVSLFVVDRLGGAVMWWINQHTHDVSGPKIKYLVNDVHEDIVLMGTSRCNSHYVPSIIRDSVGMSVYNGGIDASYNIYSHYIIFNHILAIHHPKVLCLEVQPSDFIKQSDPFTCITFFAPYIGMNERADSVFRLAHKYWPYRISHLYRYNAKAVSNIAGLAINRHSGGDCGYIPNPKPAKFPNKLYSYTTPTHIDSLKIDYLHRFISLCKQNNIQLIFTIAPSYKKVESDCYDVLKEIARENHFPFLDYHTKGLFLDHPEYFHDKDHLWDKGARLYSAIFAHDLKNVLDSLD